MPAAKPQMATENTKAAPHRRGRVKLWIAAALIGLLGGGLGLWWLLFHRSDLDQGLQALQAACREQRPLEMRITGLNYAPAPPTTRGMAEEKLDPTASNRAARLIRDAAASHPDARSLHALGRLYLVGRKFNEAIDQFEQALKANPDDAQVHSDYGIAQLERGKIRRADEEQGRSMEDLADSIAHFNRALELDGNLLAAIFNRALYHEYMTMRHQAVEDWQTYLDKDPNSPWATEAKLHLSHLEALNNEDSLPNEDLLSKFISAYQAGQDHVAWGIVSQNREAITGKLIWWQLLDAFLGQGEAGATRLEAAEALKALSYLGQKEKDIAGDPYVADLTAFYARLPRTHLERLADAHRLIDQGHALCRASRYSEARSAYALARPEFQKAGDIWEASFADYWIGYCYQRTTQPGESRALLEALMQTCRNNGFLWLLAQATNKLATVMADTHHLSKAIDYTKEALQISERIADTYGAQKNIAQLANLYKYIDDYQTSLRSMRRCLESAKINWPGPRQMWRNYETLAEIFTAMHLYAAAVDYEKEALLLALKTIKDPAFTYMAYVHLGLIYGKLQNYADAMNFAQLGYQSVEPLSGGPGGLDMMAYAATQVGYIHRLAGNFDDALTWYDKAIGFLKRSDDITAYEAHKGRLLCCLARHNDDPAKAELQIVLKFAADYRARIVEEKNRNKFFDVEQKFYDEAINFEYTRLHDERGAFALSETLRARSLLDLMQTGARVADGENEGEIKFPYVSEPLSLDAIQNQLPDNIQLLEYSVLPDKLLIWVIANHRTGDNFFVAKVDISADDLKEKVLHYGRLVASASTPADEILKASQEMYEILIRPVAGHLNRDKQICIIPEKVLCHLPFNTLVSPDSGNYLISDYSLLFSPSANIYLLCTSEAARKGGSRFERILSVGDPLIDRQSAESFQSLPDAAREASEIIALYDKRCLLIEQDATKSAVKTEMRKADVIHLASHYAVDEQSPMLSHLLLAGEAAADSWLQADEIYREKPLRARLIVLSGCQTGVERYYNSEGMIGMSRTFIASGIPLVVASLWPVDSEATAELMIKFHQYRRQRNSGFTSVEALRQAQRDLITGPDPRYRHPYYWAPFIAVGGSTNF